MTTRVHRADHVRRAAIAINRDASNSTTRSAASLGGQLGAAHLDTLREADLVIAHQFTFVVRADADLLTLVSDARADWLERDRDLAELKILIDELSGLAWEYATLRRPESMRARRRVADALQAGLPGCYSELLIGGPKPPPLAQLYFLK